MEQERFTPILIIDNEYENISALEEVLERAGQKTFGYSQQYVLYAEGAEEATGILLEAMQCRKQFSAVICDNHLYDHIDGDDYLRILRGQIGYCYSREEQHLHLNLNRFATFADIERCVKPIRNRDITLFMETAFETLVQYRACINYHFLSSGLTEQPFILYCGSLQKADTSGLYDVHMVQKDADISEYRILEILENEGVFTSDVLEKAVNGHHRLSPLVQPKKRRYNPASHHIKRRKKILLKNRLR